ncbi:MAG: hypothetical protein PHS72_08005 [Lachnospiraceae bacterium]|nr:hypothetical protein [Lachnospiraceae bacterium]
MSDKKLLGIDIGSYRLKIVESDGGRIRKAVTVDLPDNLVKNGRIVAFAAMALFIRETLKKNKFRLKTVRCRYHRKTTMPAESIFHL